MDRDRQGMGLCSTCRYVETCGFRRKPNKPVWFCEEFDGASDSVSEPAAGKKTISKPSQSQQTAAIEIVPGGKALLGLCVNCDLRADCALPQPEGGVWHCNEYR